MMATNKNAKNRKPPSTAVARGQGPPWLTIVAVVVILLLAGGIFAVVLNKNNEKAAQADALAPFTPSVDNPDPSTKIPGIYVGAATPATADNPASCLLITAAISRGGRPAILASFRATGVA